MKKSLLLLILPAVFLLSNCKKDKTTTPTTTYILNAYILGKLWNPDTLSATITYNAVAKTKILAFGGQKDSIKMNLFIKDSAPANTLGFTIGTYKVDSTAKVAIYYYTKVKNNTGNYVFQQYGTVGPGSGTVTVTAVDTVAKTLTGTFSFTTKQLNYDGNGNIISIDAATAQSGAFNAMPYTLKKE